MCNARSNEKILRLGGLFLLLNWSVFPGSCNPAQFVEEIEDEDDLIGGIIAQVLRSCGYSESVAVRVKIKPSLAGLRLYGPIRPESRLVGFK